MMKVEWNDDNGIYYSRLLVAPDAWELYYELEEQGLPVGIESMSKFECEQYLKKDAE